MANIIGIDIGGTNFRIGTIDASNQLHHFEQRSIGFITKGHVVENLAKVIEAYIQSHGEFGKIDHITVGLPSIVSKDKSYVYSTPNLPILNELDLGHLLSETLKLPVYIDRDVNFLLYHDIHKMDLDPNRDQTILGFYYGTGLGNAIYIQGKSYQGSHGAAGELGHIPFPGVTTPCGCGNSGCAELLCSGKRLTEIVDMIPEARIESVFTQFKDNPLLVEYIQNLSMPIATEANILDPDTIVLGGGVLFMKDFPKEELLSEIKTRLRKPFPSRTVNFRFAAHNQQSGVLGGAYLIRQLGNKDDYQYKRY